MRFDLFDIIVRAIVLLTTIPVHEAAHAYVADKLGDPTAKYQGRLTLNPMAHFDLMGSLAMLLVGIGWAKPVPINPRNFKDQKAGMAISAAAGPISNIILATISLVIAKVLMYTGLMFGTNVILSTLFTIFNSMCLINIYLAMFNLIPVPPFDGSRIFNYFLPDKYYFKIMEYERYVFIAVFFVVYSGLLRGPLNFVSGFVFEILDKLTFFVDIFGKMLG